MTDRDLLPKIVSARITTFPYLGDQLPEVSATFDTGREEKLFEYYLGEISFQPSDFLGLTAEEARLLRYGRDRSYLQS